jgi:hypothetical protein
MILVKTDNPYLRVGCHNFFVEGGNEGGAVSDKEVQCNTPCYKNSN